MYKRTLIALVVFMLLFGVVYLLEWSLRIPSQIKGAQRFEQLDFKFENEPASAWRSVSLPHNWDKSEPNRGGIGVYRAKLSLLSKPIGPIGFYLPKVSMNAEILLNGTSIGSGGSMKDPVARYWNQPIYLILPASLWKKGENIVKIRVAGFPNGRSGLGEIFVGQNVKILPQVEKYRLQLMLLDVGSFSINLILGVMLLFWAKKTKEIAIFYFAIGALFSSIVIADSFWIDVPLYRFTWRWITHVSIAYSVIFYYLFMLKMLKKKIAWFETAVIFYLSVGSMVLYSANQGQLLPWASWLHLGSLLAMVQLIILSGKSWIKNANTMHLWLGGCISLVLFFGLVDWIPTILHLPKQSPYIYYVGPVAFSFAVSIGLLSRYVHALETEHNYTEKLQQSLSTQQERLDNQHQLILGLEKDQAVYEERDRIVRELHDGIGGQLMGALSLSEKKDLNIEKQIRYALDELRVIMDSLDPDSDFLTMLGMFRQRIEGDLNRNNIKLKWLVECTPTPLLNSPEKSLQAMRIVQEAIANTIKYAHSSEITIIVKQNNLTVSDNGIGIQNNNNSGRGIQNMRWRTEQLKAKFNIESSTKGTEINITW